MTLQCHNFIQIRTNLGILFLVVHPPTSGSNFHKSFQLYFKAEISNKTADYFTIRVSTMADPPVAPLPNFVSQEPQGVSRVEFGRGLPYVQGFFK